MKNYINNLKSKFSKGLIGFCYTKYPGKKTFHYNFIFLAFFVILFMFLIASSILTDSDIKDRHFSINDNSKDNLEELKSSALEVSSCNIDGISCSKTSIPDPQIQGIKKAQKRHPKIKYTAHRIIVNKNYGIKTLPIGTKLVGVLLTPIDSRISFRDFIHVILPKGVSYQGRWLLPPRTVLLGQGSYPLGGKRVFIRFKQAILPMGKEISIEALALDARDFLPGLIGSRYGSFKKKFLSQTGIAFVSGISDVLQEKEALGISSKGFSTFPVVSTKSTLKNALLQGVSEASKTKAVDLGQVQGPYVKIKSKKLVIVRFIQNLKFQESFKKKNSL